MFPCGTHLRIPKHSLWLHLDYPSVTSRASNYTNLSLLFGKPDVGDVTGHNSMLLLSINEVFLKFGVEKLDLKLLKPELLSISGRLNKHLASKLTLTKSAKHVKK